MRKYIVCFSLLLFCFISSIYGQVVSTKLADYCGTWQGQDANGNSYKLILNNDYSGQVIINGKNTGATLFKMELEKSVNSLGYGVIDFYAPSQNSSQNTLTLTANSEPWQMQQCGIIKLDGTHLILQLDKGLNRPLQFDVAQSATLAK